MSHSRVVQEVMSRANGPCGEQFILELEEFLREKDAAEKRASQASLDSAREQFFNAIYARDVDLLTLLLTGSRKKFVHANMLSATDSWTPLHACLYKYNQFPPMATIRIVKLLLEHSADVNRPCPTGAIAISVTDKKQPRRSGSEPAERESRLVRFQNKTALEVAIDFLQSYKWAGCRPALLERWTPLIHLLDEASQNASRQKSESEQNTFYQMPEIELEKVPVSFRKKFCRLFEEQIGCDCTLFCTPSPMAAGRSSSPPKDEQKCFGLEDDDEQRGECCSIAAHKCVLMASSPVFEAMLSNQMREALESRIEISDVPFDVLEVMVRFMYFHQLELVTSAMRRRRQQQQQEFQQHASSSSSELNDGGIQQQQQQQLPPSSPLSSAPSAVVDESESKVNGDENNGVAVGLSRNEKLKLLLPLLAAADKYHMPDLKHSVEWELKPLLEVETAVSIFVSAHRHRATNLCEICVAFICDNFGVIKDTNDYDRLKTEYPELISVILERFAVLGARRVR